MGRQSGTSKSKGKAIQTVDDKGKGKRVQGSKTTSMRANPQLVINEERVGKNARERESANASEENNEDTHARREISPTRWLDVGLLTRMGILEEVKTVLGRIGTTREPDMDYVYYLAMEEKRRLQNVPSPSPGVSDNPSFHLTSSDQEDSN